MKKYQKKIFPVEKVRRFLEPGPTILVTSAYQGATNIMTMGWYTILEFSPSLIGCFIWEQDHSFEMIKKSKECVINVPTVELAETVVAIGNTTGKKIDKFAQFGLTAVNGKKVAAPLIQECYASFECKLVDAKLIKKYSLFIFKVVAAHAAVSPKYPTTIHYRGDGQFMVAGKNLNMRKNFKPQNL